MENVFIFLVLVIIIVRHPCTDFISTKFFNKSAGGHIRIISLLLFVVQFEISFFL